MLTCLVRNWRESGEFFILAPTKEIADNSFLPMRDMVRADPELQQIMHIQENQRTITHRITKAFVKVIAADADTVGGKKTIGLIIDELWLFGKRANAEAIIREAKGGLASRREGFVISLSTKPDGPPAGIYAQRLEYFRGVRDGKIDDPSSCGVIYEFPKKFVESGAFKQPRYWHIPNPNLGTSVDETFLRREMAKAARGGEASLANFFAKHLNLEPKMLLRAGGWGGVDVWDRGRDETLTLESLLDRSEVVVVGVDGGGNDDLLGLCVLGRERDSGRWLVWTHGVLSTVGVRRRRANATKYLAFAKAGALTLFHFVRQVSEDAGAAAHEPLEQDAGDESETEPSLTPDEDAETEGAVAELLALARPSNPDPNAPPPDVEFLCAIVKRIKDKGLLAKVGVDPAGLGAIVDGLNRIGVTEDFDLLTGVRQGSGLGAAIDTVDRMLTSYRLLYAGSPLIDWCVANLIMVPTWQGKRVSREAAGYAKIDPAVAMFNAAHLMSFNPEAAGSLYSADRGFLVFG